MSKQQPTSVHYSIFTMLMQDFTVFGYARTKLTDEQLRNMISNTLTCRIDKKYAILLNQLSHLIFNRLSYHLVFTNMLEDL